MFNRYLKFVGIRRFSGSGTKAFPDPPRYFSHPNASIHQPVVTEQNLESHSRLQVFRDLGSGIATIALVYFAIDNYLTRVQLTQAGFDRAVEQQKSLAVAQMTFNSARKKREIQVLNERKSFQKREMKMALHVALLRKQLEEAGKEPVDINTVIEQFEDKVKMEVSMANFTGTSFWLNGENDLKKYIPDSHEYDRK